MAFRQIQSLVRRKASSARDFFGKENRARILDEVRIVCKNITSCVPRRERRANQLLIEEEIIVPYTSIRRLTEEDLLKRKLREDKLLATPFTEYNWAHSFGQLHKRRGSKSSIDINWTQSLRKLFAEAKPERTTVYNLRVPFAALFGEPNSTEMADSLSNTTSAPCMIDIYSDSFIRQATNKMTIKSSPNVECSGIVKPQYDQKIDTPKPNKEVTSGEENGAYKSMEIGDVLDKFMDKFHAERSTTTLLPDPEPEEVEECDTNGEIEDVLDQFIGNFRARKTTIIHSSYNDSSLPFVEEPSRFMYF